MAMPLLVVYPDSAFRAGVREILEDAGISLWPFRHQMLELAWLQTLEVQDLMDLHSSQLGQPGECMTYGNTLADLDNTDRLAADGITLIGPTHCLGRQVVYNELTSRVSRMYRRAGVVLRAEGVGMSGNDRLIDALDTAGGFSQGAQKHKMKLVKVSQANCTTAMRDARVAGVSLALTERNIPGIMSQSIACQSYAIDANSGRAGSFHTFPGPIEHGLAEYDAADGTFPAAAKTVSGLRRAMHLALDAHSMYGYNLATPRGYQTLRAPGEMALDTSVVKRLKESIDSVCDEMTDRYERTDSFLQGVLKHLHSLTYVTGGPEPSNFNHAFTDCVRMNSGFMNYDLFGVRSL